MCLCNIRKTNNSYYRKWSSYIYGFVGSTHCTRHSYRVIRRKRILFIWQVTRLFFGNIIYVLHIVTNDIIIPNNIHYYTYLYNTGSMHSAAYVYGSACIKVRRLAHVLSFRIIFEINLTWIISFLCVPIILIRSTAVFYAVYVTIPSALFFNSTPHARTYCGFLSVVKNVRG